MNKKRLVTLCFCAVLPVALVILLLALRPGAGQPDNDKKTEAGTTEASVEETKDVETAPEISDDVPEQITKPFTPAVSPENVDMGTVKGETDEVVGENERVPQEPTRFEEPEETAASTETTISEEDAGAEENILGDDFDITKLTYEEYTQMNGRQQRAVIALFGSPEDFMTWYKAVEAIYKAEHPEIEIGTDGNVNLGG